MDKEVSFGPPAAVRSPILVDLDEGPPALINLLAENYRFKLAARHSPLPSRPPPSPCPVISILLDASHVHQTLRVAHFLPHPHDAVPRNASQFDVQAATAQHNAACYERQQLAIHRAARRHEARPVPRAASSQGASPRISYERQPQRIATGGINLQARQHRTRGRQQIALERLGETLRISKVAVPGRKRRKSSKPIMRDALEVAKQSTAEGKSTPRRYRSPPPRMPGRGASSVKGVVGEHLLQIQRPAESASDA
jgi:hypothetical protein